MVIITSIIGLLTGLAIFMVGIHQMSSGLEKLSSRKMQQGLAKIPNNRFVSFGFGAFITTIMQSSTLVTVMTLSFINANLLTLFQGIGIVLGANIGTTLTGVMTSIGAFDFAIYFSLTIFIGVVMEMVSDRPMVKKIGQILIGFGLIFVGLASTKAAFQVPEIKTMIQEMIQVATSTPVYPLILAILGIIITALVHSSSLIISLAILLVGGSVIPLNAAIFIVLGAEIGTTITGLIASLSANSNAKRLAVVQFIFNVVGSSLFLTLMWVFSGPAFDLLAKLPVEFSVSIFQIVFNVSTALVAVIFMKSLEKMSYKLIKDKNGHQGDLSMWYADEKLLSTPSFALTALQKEIDRMFILTKENLAFAFEDLLAYKLEHKSNVLKNEDIIDYLNNNIALYLVKLSSEHMGYHDELEIGKMYHVINDLERIADHAYNFVKITEEMVEDHHIFSNPAHEELKEMSQKVMHMYDLAIDIFMKDDVSRLDELSISEYIIDKMKANFENNHVTRLRTGECQIEHSRFFYDLTSQLERIGDHLINVGYSIVNVVGDQNDKEIVTEKKQKA